MKRFIFPLSKNDTLLCRVVNSIKQRYAQEEAAAVARESGKDPHALESE